jgi:hypothetical protein
MAICTCISHFEKNIHIKQVYFYGEIKLLQRSFYLYFHVLAYSKSNTSKLEMPKIVSVETLKKQENDFITRVV